MALLGNAKPTPEQLAQFRKNAGKGRIWIYQNLQFGHTDWGKLIFLQKPYAPPSQVEDPVDGTLWRYVLVGYIPDLKTGEIWECSMGPKKPQDPRQTRKVIPGPWRKKIHEPPLETGMGRVIMAGSLPPDHPIYSRGPMIFGRPSPTPGKSSTKEGGE